MPLHPLFYIGSQDHSSVARFRALEQIRPIAFTANVKKGVRGNLQKPLMKSGARFCPSLVVTKASVPRKSVRFRA